MCVLVNVVDYKRIDDSFFSKRWLFQIPQGDNVVAQTCRVELERRLPHIPAHTWPERFALGGVYLAGKAAHADDPIVPPCRLEYYEPRYDISRLAEFYPPFLSNYILAVDDDVGVAFKPAGLPTTATRDQSTYNMQRYLSDYLSCAVHCPSRLDTAVAGLLLFSISSRMNRALQKAYEGHRIHKIYLASVGGAVAWKELDIRHPLGRDPRHPVLRRVVAEGGEWAHTRVSTLSTADSHELEQSVSSLVQAEPLTGRTHQIRVHCAAEGAPIKGDPYYGGVRVAELQLISFALRFFHPFCQEVKTYYTPRSVWPAWLLPFDAAIGPLEDRVCFREMPHYVSTKRVK